MTPHLGLPIPKEHTNTVQQAARVIQNYEFLSNYLKVYLLVSFLPHEVMSGISLTNLFVSDKAKLLAMLSQCKGIYQEAGDNSSNHRCSHGISCW